MAERIVQVSAELVEHVRWVFNTMNLGPNVVDALTAVLSLPTPSAEPVDIEDMAPGTTFTSDGVMFMRCAVDIPGRPGDVVNTVGWFYNSGYFDPSTIRDVTPPKEQL